jgi:hypothetical protein
MYGSCHNCGYVSLADMIPSIVRYLAAHNKLLVILLYWMQLGITLVPTNQFGKIFGKQALFNIVMPTG